MAGRQRRKRGSRSGSSDAACWIFFTASAAACCLLFLSVSLDLNGKSNSARREGRVNIPRIGRASVTGSVPGPGSLSHASEPSEPAICTEWKSGRNLLLTTSPHTCSLPRPRRCCSDRDVQEDLRRAIEFRGRKQSPTVFNIIPDRSSTGNPAATEGCRGPTTDVRFLSEARQGWSPGRSSQETSSLDQGVDWIWFEW